MSIVKSFSVGDGDMFYIYHNSDNFTTIDCCYYDEDNRNTNFNELKTLANQKGITRFISTHPDEDHIKGISELCNTIGISNFYCVKNEATKEIETESFKKYCELRDSSKAFYIYDGCYRKWMNMSDDERSSSGINIKWPNTANNNFISALEAAKTGKEYNNLSPIFTYSVDGNVTIMWLGDIEHDFLEKIKDEIDWTEIDILFAPHHGRGTGKIPSDVLKKLNPHVIIIGEAPSKFLNYYQGYNTITQNSAGDITFICSGNYVNIYISSTTYSYDTSFLEKQATYSSKYGNYLGSFKPKNA